VKLLELKEYHAVLITSRELARGRAGDSSIVRPHVRRLDTDMYYLFMVFVAVRTVVPVLADCDAQFCILALQTERFHAASA
jgi:hypothetical protein